MYQAAASNCTPRKMKSKIYLSKITLQLVVHKTAKYGELKVQKSQQVVPAWNF